MKSVLLTGATGFIGQRLQSALIDQGYRVEALVRPSSVSKARLNCGVTLLAAELNDSEKLVAALRRADAVIYCAGTVRGSTLDDFKAANIDGVATLVASIKQAALDTPFLLLSSLAASRPQVSDYSNSKYLGEQVLVQSAGFPWTILRPTAVYGPGDREMLPILKLARKGIVTPTGARGQRISLVYVDDVASACITWLQHWQNCQRQTFDLDDGHPGGYSWREIAEVASGGRYLSVRIPTWFLSVAARINLHSSRLLGRAPMLTPGKVRELTQPDWLCDNERFMAATGWRPEFDLKNGLQTLFELNE
jgi:nucleoside-diphosphate-sugar epimerase